MVRQRGRTDPQTEKEIEAFAAQAEQPRDVEQPLATVAELPKPKAEPKVEPKTPSKAPARSKPSPDMPDWKRRNREPKSGGINFRASSSQLDLLREAALVEEISQQKVLERLVWPILEERYGSGQSAK
jgi:hypothetical protein